MINFCRHPSSKAAKGQSYGETDCEKKVDLGGAGVQKKTAGAYSTVGFGSDENEPVRRHSSRALSAKVASFQWEQ